MRTIHARTSTLLLVALLAHSSNAGAADTPNNATNYSAEKTVFAPDSLPPELPAAPATGAALCRGNFLKPEQGKAVLDFALATYSTIDLWRTHADHLRACIQAGAGLDPLPKRTPLNPILGQKRVYDGYTVQNIALETIPGFWACGNLYRPLNIAGQRVPAILNTHGHSKNQPTGGRFDAGVQQRCATLARMGAIALSMEMFGYGESLNQVPKEAHESTLAMTIQLWNNIRAIDFLESLKDVDPKRIAVTGESGGGTQSFLLTALDGRIALNVPVVMVSSYFFGGCMCESGRPIHRSDAHFCTNAEIASLCAPRPMLVISDGKDWTQNVPKVEFPFLQKIYSLYAAPDNVENVHLADEGHDYGPSKRLAMYRFLARKFNLNLDQAKDASGQLDERKVTIEKPEDLHAFADAAALPAHALHGVEAIETALHSLQVPSRAMNHQFGEPTVAEGKIALTANGQLQNTATANESLAGHIGLQSEGGEMEYRKIELTPIKAVTLQ
jgi:hypothetical protein